MEKYLKIEKNFIQNEFISAPPIYAVLYIYLLNKSANNILKINLAEVEDETKISITEITNCLKYFDRKKILLVQTELGGNTIIKFDVENEVVQQSFVAEKKEYSNEELLAIKKGDEQIEELINYVEEVTGSMFDHKDLNIIYSFYDYYKLPMDVIFFMIAYCVNNGHRNLKYIEKVAQEWSKKEIKSLEDAERYLMDYNKEYKEILKALGVKTGVVKANKDYMDKWLLNQKMPLELILEACERTVLITGQPTFKYVDGIIKDWYEKGVKTVEDIKKLDETFKEKSKEKNQKRSNFNSNTSTTTAKPKFADYKQRNLDFDKIQQQALQKQLNQGL